MHLESGDYLVRTTSYSLPKKLHEHIDLIQPTTMFGRFKAAESTVYDFEDADVQLSNAEQSEPIINSVTGVPVDASCNKTITISCLEQLYNAVGYIPSANIGNSIGITGYLGQFANIADLQV